MIARLRSAAFTAFHVERGMMVRLLLAWIVIPAAALHADEPLREVINRELAPVTLPPIKTTFASLGATAKEML